MLLCVIIHFCGQQICPFSTCKQLIYCYSAPLAYHHLWPWLGYVIKSRHNLTFQSPIWKQGAHTKLLPSKNTNYKILLLVIASYDNDNCTFKQVIKHFFFFTNIKFTCNIWCLTSFSHISYFGFQTYKTCSQMWKYRINSGLFRMHWVAFFIQNKCKTIFYVTFSCLEHKNCYLS